MGAELYPLRPNYIRILYSQARNYITSKGGAMLPFGVSCIESTMAVAEEFSSIPEDLLTGTLVVCVGSGTILSGIISGLKRLPNKILGISSGMSAKNQFNNINQLLFEANVGLPHLCSFNTSFLLIPPIMPYSEVCSIDTPFPSHGNYDKKAFKFMVDNIDKLKKPILFVNIGS